MNKLHNQILEKEIITPQLRKQVGWVDNPPIEQTPWNKDLAYLNCSFDLNEEGHEGEDLDKMSAIYKSHVTVF